MTKSTLFTYDDRGIGTDAITSGDLFLAEAVFSGIAEHMEAGTTADIYQQWGIVQRLVGDRDNNHLSYHLAVEKFTLALERAENDIHRGQILRDCAMAYVGLREYDTAYDLLVQSNNHLRPTRKPRLSPVGRLACHVLLLHGRLAEDKRARITRDTLHEEYYVTQGFIARIYHLWGGRKNQRTARRMFRCANRELRGIKPYELNNRVWDLKVEPIWYRLILAPRTFALAKQSGNWKRQLQVGLLVACRPLALYLEQRRRDS